MTKSCALLLSAALLAVPSGHAEEAVVRADWVKARAMLTQGEYRPRIAVELKSPKRVTLTQDRGEFHPRNRKEVELKPGKWVKGKLIEATGAGLQLVYREHEINFQREDISRIRLVTRSNNRWTGLVLGIPVGIGLAFAAGKAYCGSSGGCGNAEGLLFLIGVPIAVAYVFHKVVGGKRADRGAVVVVLDEGTASKPPVPAQASGPSPVR